MRYVRQDNKNEDDVIFRCSCGEWSFIELHIWDDKIEGFEFGFYFMEEPRGFFERLKWLFKKETYCKEILLSKKDIQYMKEMLNKLCFSRILERKQ